jgi:hypothetical protein
MTNVGALREVGALRVTEGAAKRAPLLMTINYVFLVLGKESLKLRFLL